MLCCVMLCCVMLCCVVVCCVMLCCVVLCCVVQCCVVLCCVVTCVSLSFAIIACTASSVKLLFYSQLQFIRDEKRRKESRGRDRRID